MNKVWMTADQLRQYAFAITDPHNVPDSNKFAKRFSQLRSQLSIKKDWELQDPANDLITGFVEGKLVKAARAIQTVIQSTNAKITPDDIVKAYLSLKPSLTDLKAVISRSTNGCGIIIHDFEYERAYENVVAASTAELRLLGSEAEKPIHPVQVKQRFVAPDTNALIHFKSVMELVPSDVGVDAPLRWLFLEQVISEVDHKAHHHDSFYSGRAKKLKKLFLRVESDELAIGKESTARIHFSGDLPIVDGLDLTIPDHRIIAQAIGFQQANPGTAVTIATSDTALAMRARALGFETAEFPESLRRLRTEE